VNRNGRGRKYYSGFRGPFVQAQPVDARAVNSISFHLRLQLTRYTAMFIRRFSSP
jgi:hypothetical protein